RGEDQGAVPRDRVPSAAPSPEEVQLPAVEARDTERIHDVGTVYAYAGSMGAARAALHFLGHSTALVDIDGTRILTDPLLVSGLGPIRRRPHATHDGLQGITPDAVVISHAHHDHLHLPSLRRLVGRPPLIVPAGLGRLVARDGHDVTEISPGERLRVGGLTIEATQALHHPGRGPLGPAAIAIGFRIAGS